MKIVKYLIFLFVWLTFSDWAIPTAAHAKSIIPVSCLKIKQKMASACHKKQKSCSSHTNALNRCLKKSAFQPASKGMPVSAAVCAMIYQPICGQTAKGSFQLYSNSCFAKIDGAVEAPLYLCETK